MKIERTDIRLYADPKKVLLRYLNLGLKEERINPIVDFVKSLTREAVREELSKLRADFSERHFNFDKYLFENFGRVSSIIKDALSPDQKLLIGAYFTHEYSIQAAALFNPSIVAHPDQSDMEAGELKFIMSLRSTGEGHISSISFLTGKITKIGAIELDHTTRLVSEGSIKESEDGYEIDFDESIPLNSRVIFPFLPEESMGMEDARFVQMQDGAYKYIGTYTAYNGKEILPKFILTNDFRKFKVIRLKEQTIKNKGMAVFPRKINGKFVMIGRQDGKNLSIMFSESLFSWDKYEKLQEPQQYWEMLQIGNNGSPIETEQGWLLLTHGVGPLRKYTLGMTLLDLDDPSKIISSLKFPILSPTEEEREGYVPNVLYTCGILEHQGTIYIPYAMSDHAISFAKVQINEILDQLLTT